MADDYNKWAFSGLHPLASRRADPLREGPGDRRGLCVGYAGAPAGRYRAFHGAFNFLNDPGRYSGKHKFQGQLH